jgi:hypothetical protein
LLYCIMQMRLMAGLIFSSFICCQTLPGVTQTLPRVDEPYQGSTRPSLGFPRPSQGVIRIPPGVSRLIISNFTPRPELYSAVLEPAIILTVVTFEKMSWDAGFLGAKKLLFKRLRLSVGPLVGLSVRPHDAITWKTSYVAIASRRGGRGKLVTSLFLRA